MNNKIETKIGSLLLQSKAIILQPANPFIWASGWKAPIYCDNRRTLSFPEVRTEIKNEFVRLVKDLYPQAEVIAGVATGAIAQGVLVAEALNLPFVYVRSSAKGHGLSNLIEGFLEPGQKVVVIEDLISTGASSLNAVHALRNAGADVLGMLAIFTYDFNVARKNFNDYHCVLHTLTNYQAVISLAAQSGYVKNEELVVLQQWRDNPDTWKQ